MTRLKLSGNMVDATDRDLMGEPTLEGECNPRITPEREQARTKYASFLADFTVANADEVLDVLIERDALREAMSKADDLLLQAYGSAPDGMLPAQICDARKLLTGGAR